MGVRKGVWGWGRERRVRRRGRVGRRPRAAGHASPDSCRLSLPASTPARARRAASTGSEARLEGRGAAATHAPASRRVRGGPNVGETPVCVVCCVPSSQRPCNSVGPPRWLHARVQRERGGEERCVCAGGGRHTRKNAGVAHVGRRETACHRFFHLRSLLPPRARSLPFPPSRAQPTITPLARLCPPIRAPTTNPSPQCTRPAPHCPPAPATWRRRWPTTRRCVCESVGTTGSCVCEARGAENKPPTPPPDPTPFATPPPTTGRPRRRRLAPPRRRPDSGLRRRGRRRSRGHGGRPGSPAGDDC